MSIKMIIGKEEAVQIDCETIALSIDKFVFSIVPNTGFEVVPILFKLSGIVLSLRSRSCTNVVS